MSFEPRAFTRRAAPGKGRGWLLLAAAAVAAAWTAGSPRAATPRFFPDDPIQVDDDRAIDASKTRAIEGSNAYDFAENTFFPKGDTADIRAVNVNSIDEVPDSSWFTNRIGRGPIPIADLVRGPNQRDAISVDDWIIVREKSSGITPGYRIVDPSDERPRPQLYQVKFDPPSNPGMASSAEVIGAAIYHALGYNVVQGYIVEIDPDQRIYLAGWINRLRDVASSQGIVFDGTGTPA